MESLYCAACMTTLPPSVVWKRGKDTMPVRGWDDAVIAHEMGFRYDDHIGMTWGIFAVTQVAGTLYCYGHGYFAMTRVFKEMQDEACKDSQARMDRKEGMRHIRTPFWRKSRG